MPDDLVYAVILVVSVGCGPLVRVAKEAVKRRLLCTTIGLALMVFACGWDSLHPLIVTAGNCLLIVGVGPRYCHIASFIWCFGYLIFFRLAHFFGIPSPHPVTNILHMFNAIRMVGVAFEVHDAAYLERRSHETDEDVEFKKCKALNPSTLDILTYAFCYLGIFTGPYYKYRTFHDLLNQPSGANIASWKFVSRRLWDIPLIALAHFSVGYFFNINYVRTEEFYTNPWWFRWFYSCMMLILARTRLYMAWIISEIMCMTAGLGAYPVECKAKCGEGLTDLKAFEESKKKDQKLVEYEFETIHNVHIDGIEWSATVKECMRSWNMTVQYWMAAYVHQRLPRKYGQMRIVITMAVSAFWHGMHPGHYLSFLTVPLMLLAEDLMTKAFRKNSAFQIKMFDYASAFFKVRSFEYTGMGFMLSTFNDTFAYWYSLYFAGHFVYIFLILIGILFKPKASKSSKVE